MRDLEARTAELDTRIVREVSEKQSELLTHATSLRDAEAAVQVLFSLPSHKLLRFPTS